MHLCCTESAKEFLRKEGITDTAYVVGDPMYDAFLYYSEKVGNDVPENLTDLNGQGINLPEHFYYMTCHREENAGTDKTLTEILEAMDSLEYPTIYPVHPRNRARVQRIVEAEKLEHIICCEPVGYLMSVYLVNHSEKIVTDSGGLQREAFFAKKQCVTVFDYVVWPETMKGNRNQLAKPDKEDILTKLNKEQMLREDYSFGDGKSYQKIVEKIEKLV